MTAEVIPRLLHGSCEGDAVVIMSITGPCEPHDYRNYNAFNDGKHNRINREAVLASGRDTGENWVANSDENRVPEGDVLGTHGSSQKSCIGKERTSPQKVFKKSPKSQLAAVGEAGVATLLDRGPHHRIGSSASIPVELVPVMAERATVNKKTNKQTEREWFGATRCLKISRKGAHPLRVNGVFPERPWVYTGGGTSCPGSTGRPKSPVGDGMVH